MSEPDEPVIEKMPQNKRFQLHLSTALIVMFLAGGLLWWNVSKPYDAAPDNTLGWPVEVHWSNSDMAEDSSPKEWAFFKLGCDALFSISLLVAFAIFWEKLGNKRRKHGFVFGTIYLLLWLLTGVFGVPTTSKEFYETVAQNVEEKYMRRTSAGEFSTQSGYVSVASSPLPFVVKVRTIKIMPPPEDRWHQYYFWWFWGKPQEVAKIFISDGQPRKK